MALSRSRCTRTSIRPSCSRVRHAGSDGRSLRSPASAGTPRVAIATGQKACNLSRMRTRPNLSGAVRDGVVRCSALGFAACLLVGPGACKPAKIKATQDNSELGQVVAKVDDNVITVGDVQERINKQAPFVRSRYTTLDKKKEFLDNLIRFEVMAAEAQKRG